MYFTVIKMTNIHRQRINIKFFQLTVTVVFLSRHHNRRPHVSSQIIIYFLDVIRRRLRCVTILDTWWRHCDSDLTTSTEGRELRCAFQVFLQKNHDTENNRNFTQSFSISPVVKTSIRTYDFINFCLVSQPFRELDIDARPERGPSSRDIRPSL